MVIKNALEYSVIVPVYRGEESLIELHERVKGVFKTINKDFELIFVYDWNDLN